MYCTVVWWLIVVLYSICRRCGMVEDVLVDVTAYSNGRRRGIVHNTYKCISTCGSIQYSTGIAYKIYYVRRCGVLLV